MAYAQETRRRFKPLNINYAGNWSKEWEDKFFHIFLEFALEAHFKNRIRKWMYGKVAHQMKEITRLPFTICIVNKECDHCRIRFHQFKFIRETVWSFKWNRETNVVSIIITPNAWKHS